MFSPLLSAYLTVPTPGPQNVTLFGHGIFERPLSWKEVVRVCPNPV